MTAFREKQSIQWIGTLLLAAFFLVADVTYIMHASSNTFEDSLLHEEPQSSSSSSATTQTAVSSVFPRRRLAEKNHMTKTKTKAKTPPKMDSVEFDASDPHLALFQYSNYTVLGPTQFPKPTHIIQRSLQAKLAGLKRAPAVEVEPILKPVLGQHRSDQDAVFVFASEYDLSVYQGFILSLRKTGFQGDIVFAVSPLDMALPHDKNKPSARQAKLHEFFASDPHVIIYVVPFVCYNAEGQSVDSAKGGMRVCHCNVLYGHRNVTAANKGKGIPASATEWVPLDDVRVARPVATTRYELYWLWSIHYEKHTWQMLVDARDTYFQTDPFAAVPREPNGNRNSGVIFFFGENSDATRIGTSDKNRKWLTNAYGVNVIQAMQDKPTICSGATMGEQIALETYLRAMVNEFDETEIKLMGADQGFHNYLYYSGKLQNAHRIRSISVFDQGRGIVNNMGAMRTKELSEWGNGNMVQQKKGGEMTVLNWDGTPSPVVHQFDRFKTLSDYVYKKKTHELQHEWSNNFQKKTATKKK